MTNADITRLIRAGARLVEDERDEAAEASPASPDSLMEQLIANQAKLIEALTTAKPPVVNVAAAKAPNVTIAPANITVPPAKAAPTRWIFNHKYDNRGDLVSTIAEAQE